MYIQLEPTVDIDPDDTGSLWSHIIKSENNVGVGRPSNHCLRIDPDIFSVRITDDGAEEAAPIRAESTVGFCRPLAAGSDDFEIVVRFKIPDSYFNEELLRDATPASDNLNPITTGSAVVSVHVSPEVKELPVSYAIRGSYAIE